MQHSSISDKIKANIREVPNFPIPEVSFKDVSTIFLNPQLIAECGKALSDYWQGKGITKVLAIDSRGFLFGPQMAIQLGVGMVMVRKKGKLPPETIAIEYELEYGTASIEVEKSAIQAGDKVIIHDDLLATGGTALAAAKLAQQLGAEVLGFSFLIELDFLGGKERLATISENIHALAVYA